jgi:hypothetical protein
MITKFGCKFKKSLKNYLLSPHTPEQLQTPNMVGEEG